VLGGIHYKTFERTFQKCVKAWGNTDAEKSANTGLRNSLNTQQLSLSLCVFIENEYEAVAHLFISPLTVGA